MFYENPFIAFLVGTFLGLLGIAVEILYSRQNKRQLNEKIQVLTLKLNQATDKGIEEGEKRTRGQIDALKTEIAAQAEEDARAKIKAIHEAGLSHVSGGLDGFDNKVCELVKEARKSIRLCVATPLLHSFRKIAFKNGRWQKYHPTLTYDNSDHWAYEFCEPFIKNVADVSKMPDRDRLRVELVHLDEKVIKGYVQNIPRREDPVISTEEYIESVRYFNGSLNTGGTCEFFSYEVPDIPIYMAIIDGPEGPAGPNGKEDIPDTACGVVAFMSASEFMRQRRENRRSPDEMAQNLEVYEFTNKEVVRFFTHLFREVSLYGDLQLLKFLQHCRTHDWKWAVIAEGTDAFTKKAPYATLLHSDAPPKGPSRAARERSDTEDHPPSVLPVMLPDNQT